MNIGVVGATGFVGAEVVRRVLAHRQLTLTAVTSQSTAGKRLADVHPALEGLTDLVLEPFDGAKLSKLDAVVLATPHGAAAPLVAELAGSPLIVDCSRDHRHAEGWTYGMVEYASEALATSSRIAVPGCFATAMALAGAPLVAAGVIEGPARVVAATGSTGSGVKPSAGTHHPTRFANLKAYKVLSHQHVPEVVAFWNTLGDAPKLDFVPISAPIDRGILATLLVTVKPGTHAESIVADFAAKHPHIRLRTGSPELRFVRGTSFCDLSVSQDEDTVAVLSAIDNLGKGAAGQALQCLDLALGLAPSTLTPPALP
ncbi:MAG: N-acetyl-gamma-glutamyl-phosphate reductase [Deltaproteobacteria bacterium]|nr:MAG: N-acetyl-gamma-glutamyl-phosphate reductase [Deltaproteobacteria bacterium]